MTVRQPCWPRALLVSLLLLMAGTTPGRAEDAFARPGLVVNWWDTPVLRFQTYSELQVTDSERHFSGWTQAERFTVKPWDKLWLGVNYTFVERLTMNPATHAELALEEHRIEVEALPRLSLGESARLMTDVSGCAGSRRWRSRTPAP